MELANRWSFPEVKALAIRELEKLEMSDVDRIALYHKYKIDSDILVPRYASLCSRDQTLTADEGHKLGMDTAMTLARARECARSKSSGGRSPLPPDFKKEDMSSLIIDFFGIPKPQPNGQTTDKPAGMVVDVPDSLKFLLTVKKRKSERWRWEPRKADRRQREKTQVVTITFQISVGCLEFPVFI